jgi:hypothetical protein
MVDADGTRLLLARAWWRHGAAAVAAGEAANILLPAFEPVALVPLVLGAALGITRFEALPLLACTCRCTRHAALLPWLSSTVAARRYVESACSKIQ